MGLIFRQLFSQQPRSYVNIIMKLRLTSNSKKINDNLGRLISTSCVTNSIKLTTSKAQCRTSSWPWTTRRAQPFFTTATHLNKKSENNSEPEEYNWEFFNVPSSSSSSTSTQEQQPKRIIQDVIEQQWNPIPEPDPMQIHITEPHKQYNLERGKAGVFDLEELLDLVKQENGFNICVISIPKELDYADHMVIVTSRSPKHMYALATFIRKRFKSKHLLRSDRLPKIEGTENSDDWLALDLGNIILHVFCGEARDYYDIETLWTVGPSFDDLTHKKDSEIVQLLNLFK